MRPLAKDSTGGCTTWIDHLPGFSGMHWSNASTSGPQPSYSLNSTSLETASTHWAFSLTSPWPIGMSYRAAKATTLIWTE